MSTTPPPPPPFGYPPEPGPVSYDPSVVRAQRRAAAEQARAQREQFRQGLRASRRRSVVGPLLLIAVGVVLLLLQTGRLSWSASLQWLGLWWPAVLIAAGLLMVAEWALDRRAIQSAQGAFIPRRTLGGGTVALLVLLALVGAGAMVADHGSTWAKRHLDGDFTFNNFEGWPQLFGSGSVVTEELHAPLAPDGQLTINDPHGDITVTGSSQDGLVHVTTRQHIYAWHGDDLESRRRAERVNFTGERTALVLNASALDRDSTDLVVEVPHGASVVVHSSRGDVSVDELHGAVNLEAKDGDVKLTALLGPVHLTAQDDDADVTGHSLAGGLTIEGRTGDLNLSDIEGPVLLHGDFFGTTHLERVHGPVHFQSSFTDLACAGVPGELNIEGRSDLSARHLDGPVVLSTTNRNLTLDGVRGGATVNDRNGSVSLTLAGAADPVRVTNQNGSVDVSIPANGSFAVDARTDNGEIENNFGMNQVKSGESSHLQAKLGSGSAALNLQTTEGDLKITRVAVSSATGWDDSPTRITVGPPAVSPGRHHRPVSPTPTIP